MNKNNLKKYADLLINLALGEGKPLSQEDTLLIEIKDSAKPLLIELYKILLKNKITFFINYKPDSFENDLYNIADYNQLANLNIYANNYKNFNRHLIVKTSENINPSLYDKVLFRKENYKVNNYKPVHKVICIYPNESMVNKAGITIGEYWDQVCKACFLYEDDPKIYFQESFFKIEKIKKYLMKMDIKTLKIKGKDVDLEINVGEERQWLGGSYRNIPSFEIFLSPDFRKVNGWVRFNIKREIFGSLIESIELNFENGYVKSFNAKNGKKVLKSLLEIPGASSIGEFSLTDKRLSKIDKVLNENLFDENFGGDNGNFHIALGNSFARSYKGYPNKVDFKGLGFNESKIHLDLVQTLERTVYGVLRDGKEIVIYKDGCFNINF